MGSGSYLLLQAFSEIKQIKIKQRPGGHQYKFSILELGVVVCSIQLSF